MHPKLEHRFLLHTIDAATLSGSRKSSGWGGSFLVIGITLAACAVLILKDLAVI